MKGDAFLITQKRISEKNKSIFVYFFVERKIRSLQLLFFITCNMQNNEHRTVG